MKNITEFILEGKKHVDPATIGDFAKWYCLGEMPDGKEGKVTADDAKDLLIMDGLIILEMMIIQRNKPQILSIKIGMKILK
jgi:hypothetical protein